jgi:hypothetical protein
MAELHLPNLDAVDARAAESLFEFVQFLLDDDANLTPAGNLTGAARQRLRGRLEEIIAAETGSSAESAAEISQTPAAATDPQGVLQLGEAS